MITQGAGRDRRLFPSRNPARAGPRLRLDPSPGALASPVQTPSYATVLAQPLTTFPDTSGGNRCARPAPTRRWRQPRPAHLRAQPHPSARLRAGGAGRTDLYGAILVARLDWPAAGDDTLARRGAGPRAGGGALPAAPPGGGVGRVPAEAAPRQALWVLWHIHAHGASCRLCCILMKEPVWLKRIAKDQKCFWEGIAGWHYFSYKPHGRSTGALTRC